jgi:hypothetical protein
MLYAPPGAALGGQHHRLNAVVAMDQLKGRVVAHHRRHHLEVQVARQRLRLVRVEAVREAQGEDRDVGVADGEVAHVRLDLDDVAHELVAGVAVEAVVFAEPGREVEARSVDSVPRT